MKTIKEMAADACPVCMGINDPDTCAFHAKIEAAMLQLQNIFFIQLASLKVMSDRLIESLEKTKNSQ